MSEELKPCPICGSHASLHRETIGPNKMYCVRCDNCWVALYGVDCDELIEEWNTREERFVALKTCPFCGQPAEFWEEDGAYYVRCTCDEYGCDFYGPTCATREEAAALWNGEILKGETNE